MGASVAHNLGLRRVAVPVPAPAAVPGAGVLGVDANALASCADPRLRLGRQRLFGVDEGRSGGTTGDAVLELVAGGQAAALTRPAQRLEVALCAPSQRFARWWPALVATTRSSCWGLAGIVAVGGAAGGHGRPEGLHLVDPDAALGQGAGDAQPAILGATWRAPTRSALGTGQSWPST